MALLSCPSRMAELRNWALEHNVAESGERRDVSAKNLSLSYLIFASTL